MPQKQTSPPLPPPPLEAATADPAIEELVAAAEQLLWTPDGDFARRRLAERHWSEELIRVNRIGFDPGNGMLPRPKRLPSHGPGIVFPVLHPQTREATYYQSRTLSPSRVERFKYDQPNSDVAPNPRMAAVRHPEPPRSGLLIVCEGFPDALTAAQAGLPAIAILGTGLASRDRASSLAEQILRDHPHPAYAVFCDNDKVGKDAATRIATRLAQHDHSVARLLPPTGHKDLNTWWQADPEAVTLHLDSASTLLVGNDISLSSDILTLGSVRAPM